MMNLRIKFSLQLIIFLFFFGSTSYANGEISIEIIDSSDTERLAEAQHLLHTVYVEEEAWLPQNDRTGIEIVKDHRGRSLFVNDYDKASIRFNVILGDKVIGTARLAGSINEKFEVEHYIDLPPLLAGMKAAALYRMFEVNRLAVLPEYRSKKFALRGSSDHKTVLQALLEAVQSFSETRKWILIAAPKTEFAGYLKKQSWNHDFQEFKYLSSDPNFVFFTSRIPTHGPVLDAFTETCSAMAGKIFHIQ